MKKLVIFDLDGTLLDTAESLQICMNLALKENSLSPITLEQTRAFVGNGAYLFSLRACKDESLAKAVYESFMRIYSAYPTDKVLPFDGIIEVINRLKKQGIKTAVFSNKPHGATTSICESVFGKNCFDYLLGQMEGAPIKPDPYGINKILDYFNLSVKDAILIGDGETDAQTAINSNMDFIGVLWGLRTKQQLELGGAQIFAQRPVDLINLIDKEI